MRWVTPKLMVGTEQDATTLGFVYLDNWETAQRLISDDEVDGVVVSNRWTAESILRHLGASHDWIRAHLYTDWAVDPEAETNAQR